MKTTNDKDSLTISLIRDIIRCFAMHPEDVVLQIEEVGSLTVIKIKVHRADTPRILGRKALQWKALQAITRGLKHDHGSYSIKLLEPTVGEPEKFQIFEPRENWNKVAIFSILSRLLDQLFGRAVIVCNESEDQTVWDVSVELKEQPVRVEVLGEAIQILWNAMGKANGRILIVNVRREMESEPSQPRTAAGRFVGETE